MGFISTLSILVAVVYPVVASCRAFEDYTRVSNSIASQNLKIAGFTVPLNYFYKSEPGKDSKIDENDERALQIHLISIQKWFIYWIVIAIVSLFENVLFLKYIVPGYSFLRLGFNIWLIVPMISIQKEVDANSTFDNTVEWKKFTSNGAGLIYFSYVKPWIEQHMETIRKYSNNPVDILLSVSGLQSFFNKDATTGSPSETSSVASDYSNVLDSFVMVMNMKNKWTGTGAAPATPEDEQTAGPAAAKDISEGKSNEEFDVVDGTDDPNAQVTKRRGFFW
ncbi:hypothetical protein Cantr_08596 [Candida viswanathii]|uniref:Protein YOP1 n=1 Tax=Candida viswanathii TaxID=5486 RepID=A0A367Y5B6_9ASCO|nr:hypothetical protein Cantr_08596 [Candida viswanathii]